MKMINGKYGLNLKSGFTVIEIVIVIGVLALLVGVYYFNRKDKTSTPASTQTTSATTEVTTTPELTTTSETTTTTTTEPVKEETKVEAKPETPAWQTYTNEQFDFQLTFNDKWKGYKVEKQEAGEGSMELAVFEYVLPTTDKSWIEMSSSNTASVFAISIYTPGQWEELQKEEGPKPNYIAKNSNYVFAYSSAQALPEDLIELKVLEDIKTIIATFKLK